MFIIFIIIGLLYSVEAGNFNLQINGVKVHIFGNNTLTNQYCSTTKAVNATCIKELSICSGTNCQFLTSGSFSGKQMVVKGEDAKLSIKIEWVSEGTTGQPVQLFPMQSNLFSSRYSNDLPFENITFGVMLDMEVQCMSGYLAPDCSEVDLCGKLPGGVCQNSGVCTQKNYTIKCQCPDKFTGYYCQDKKDPCQDNVCSNNAKCLENRNLPLKYQCICPVGFTGPTCNLDDNECLNTSICNHLPNATCINTYGTYLCVCEEKCKIITTPNPLITSEIPKNGFEIKWPLQDLATLLLVTLEAAIIIVLILLLVFLQIKNSPRKKKSKSILDDNYQFVKTNKSKKVAIEFAPNYVRPPIIIEENNQSMAPMFDATELDHSFRSDLSPGMSTFGRR